MNLVEQKRVLLKWLLWFYVANAILFWIIAVNYIPTLSWLDTDYISDQAKGFLILFISLTYLGQFGLIAFLPSLFLMPLIFFIPKRSVIFSVAVLLYGIAATVLVIDVITYHLYRFHLNNVVLQIIFQGLTSEILGLSLLENIIAVIVIGSFIALELLLAFFLWRKIQKISLQGWFKWFVILITLSLYTSYCMIAFSAGYLLNRVFVDAGHVFPFYIETFAKVLPQKEGRDAFARLSERFLIQPNKINQPLHYPLEPLQFAPTKKQPFNLIIIALDAWRADMLNANVTPFTFKIAQQAWQFHQHFSGGNATGPGIFSLFYGLPESYWTAMEAQKRAPILIETLLKQHYQMGIFSSATLKLPAFNKTVFSGIDSLELTTEGASPDERDMAITKKFKRFITDRDKQRPFFSFLFYDSSHSYCAFKNSANPFLPFVEICNRSNLTNKSDPLPYLNRYKNALYFLDGQIKEIFTTLEKNHLLLNTIVILTSDHGEEFNDNGLGFWSHASNFTHCQTQTPLIIFWPGEKSLQVTHPTSHFDIAPTLMQKLFNCTTPFSSYSLGQSLLDPHPRPYFIISSYIDWGVVTPNRILVSSSLGDFRVQNSSGKSLATEKPNIKLLKSVLKDLRRFYRS